ncbi:MAG: hypothetical protein GXO74_16615 [Calditrichaeota bacterium]|nr:hypothetical protein [Calditrichota bacterium]
MSDEKSDGGSFFKGLVFGGLIGAGLALLYAPKKGDELRKDLREKSDELLGDAEKFYSDARSFSEEKFADALKRAEQLRQEAEKKFEEARTKYEQILAESKRVADDLKKKMSPEKDVEPEEGEKKKASPKKRGKISKAIEASKQAFDDEMTKDKK